MSRGKTLADYGVRHGTTLLATSGTVQPFAPEAPFQIAPVTRPASADADASFLAHQLLQNVASGPHVYDSPCHRKIIATATLRSESFKRFLTSAYVSNHLGNSASAYQREPQANHPGSSANLHISENQQVNHSSGSANLHISENPPANHSGSSASACQRVSQANHSSGFANHSSESFEPEPEPAQIHQANHQAKSANSANRSSRSRSRSRTEADADHE